MANEFTHITYDNAEIAALKGGETATLECQGMFMTTDVVITAADEVDLSEIDDLIGGEGGGGSTDGECTRNHIIEVTTLPTTNIDTNALYKMGESYYKYIDGAWVNYIVPTGTLEITANGEQDVTNYSKINVNVAGSAAPKLQQKTVTPTESQQTIQADAGYDGLSAVIIEAIPDSYLSANEIQTVLNTEV